MLKKKSRTMCLGLLVSAALTGCSSLNHISDNRFSQSKVISEREEYKINKNDLCYQLFIEKGFEWGRDWTDRKDYQHFEVPTDITDQYSEMYTK